MKHSVPHDVDQTLARRAADKAWEVYSRKCGKYHPTANWVTDRRCEIAFSTKGLKVTGSLELAPGAIDLELEVPHVLRLFKSQAIGVIEREIRKWLDRAKAGQL